MTNRSLMFRCLAIGVGLLAASRFIDADEPVKEKEGEPSKPLKVLIDKLEQFRIANEAEHRDWIFAYDEAIALIDEDIAEFKTFDVRRSGGLRVFKTQDEKDKVIQTLEQVRDGWKRRLKVHEAQMDAIATSPDWSQMPQFSLEDFERFEDFAERKFGRISWIEFSATSPAGLLPDTEVQWPGWIPARNAVATAKTNVPNQKTKTTTKKPPTKPEAAPKALEGPFEPQRPFAPGEFTPERTADDATTLGQLGVQPASDDSTHKRNLYQRLNHEMPMSLLPLPATQDERLRNLRRFVTGRVQSVEGAEAAGKSPRGLWQCTVQTVIDDRNVVVSLLRNFAPQIEKQEKTIAELRELAVNVLTSTRFSGTRSREALKQQLLDEIKAKVQGAEGEIKRLTGNQRRSELWIRGVSTKEMFDGRQVQIPELLEISGTESYVTATGAKATIPLAKAIDVHEFQKSLPPRPTIDEYHDSPAFKMMAKDRAEKAAERLKRQQAGEDVKRAQDEKKLADAEKMAETRLALAKTYLEGMKQKLAMQVLEQLIKQYPDSTARLEAEELLKQLQAGDVKKNNTVEKRVERIQAAEARLATAKQFVEKKSYKSARLLLERLVKEYPETVPSDEAKELLKTLPE